MTGKRLLMLGASYFQVPAIQYAKAAGHHVVTCDYLPDNPGHRYADEYHNVSTTDQMAVLALARNLDIDGIVAYASDPAAPTAAYVAEKLGLPGNPYQAVVTLAQKDLFRQFLAEHGFATPHSRAFQSLPEARAGLEEFQLPVFIKPVDSSGSKGVSLVNNEDQLPMAFSLALGFSRTKRVIVEEYVHKAGYQVAGDGFLVDGRLVFRLFANEHFDSSGNVLVPIGESFPSVLSEAQQQNVHDEVQKALEILGMRMGALNFDIRIGCDDRVYLMEIGPRNGGNLIPQATRYATGVDMVKATVDAALGLTCSNINVREAEGFYATYIIHAHSDGFLRRIEFSKAIERAVLERELWFDPGATVKKFDGSNCTLGTMILKFDNQAEMLKSMNEMDQHVRVIVENE
jgi:biotin carboxylase